MTAFTVTIRAESTLNRNRDNSDSTDSGPPLHVHCCTSGYYNK